MCKQRINITIDKDIHKTFIKFCGDNKFTKSAKIEEMIRKLLEKNNYNYLATDNPIIYDNIEDIPYE